VRLIGRLILIAFALPLAVTAGATALLGVAVLDAVIADLIGETLTAGFAALVETLAATGDPGFAVDGAVRLGRLALTLLVAPPVFVALAAEALGARSLLWHAGATGLVTAALPWLSRPALRPATPEEIRITLMLGIVGAAAGFVYWLIAGHGAGRPRPREPDAPGLPGRSS